MKQVVLNGTKTTVMLARSPEILPTSSDIIRLEQAWHYALPPDYRDFLLRYNGGVCDLGSIIPRLDATLAEFYCLNCGDGRFTALRLPQDWREEWPGLPGHMLPIGELDGGDLIALVYAGGRCETVVISHETDSVKMELAAASFTDFLLQTVREED